MTAATAGSGLAVEFTEHRISNGLWLLVSEDHTTPAAAVCVWYAVGSRNELPGKTGFAHLFEHIMFQGSRQVPGNGHFEILQAIGADLNGTTSFDRTNYFETVPSHELATALWLEADRMGGLLDALTEQSLDNQRDVVKNERRQRYDNQPYGTLWERVFATVMPEGHPYHHMPIGSMADLDAASLEDCREFFRRHYAPDNAVLAVVGDVEASEVLDQVEHLFGGIPGRGRPEPARDGTLAPLTETVRTEIRDEDVPAERYVAAYRVPPEGHPDLEALALAATILSDGRSSRFSSRLVRRDELAQTAHLGVQRLVGGVSVGLLSVMARSGATLADVESAVERELADFAEHGPTEEELDRGRAQVERYFLDALTTVMGRADALCEYAVLHGDPGLLATALDRAVAPTAEDCRRAVADYLRPEQRAVFTYHLPAGGGA